MGITTSGRTPYVIGAIQEAHRIGAKTIFLSCNPSSETLNQFVDVFITPIVGPEIITGSTRLKAGTATKLTLNMLTTIAMIKLGKVYNNLMVDVQAWNTKLVDRAKRIIAEITGVDYDTAGEFLKKANGSAKVAIVMIEKNVDAEKAIKLLEENNGFLRNLITEIRN
jgi:N-acetylmuramic acid 6-phosphate etherase